MPLMSQSCPDHMQLYLTLLRGNRNSIIRNASVYEVLLIANVFSEKCGVEVISFRRDRACGCWVESSMVHKEHPQGTSQGTSQGGGASRAGKWRSVVTLPVKAYDTPYILHIAYKYAACATD